MAASEAAAIERAWALEDASDYEAKATQRGVSIVEMNDEDTALLKKKSQLAYIRSHSLFSKGLVAKIKTAWLFQGVEVYTAFDALGNVVGIIEPLIADPGE